MGVLALIELYAAGFYVFLEKVVDAQEFDARVGKPVLQTKPGRKVGVASFR